MGADLSTIHTGEVREVAVQITKAGDGLSDALKVNPIALDHGDEVFYLLRGRVSQVKFTEVKPGSEDLVRVHVIVTQDITQVPEDLAVPVLRDAQVGLRKQLDEIAGRAQLPLGDEGGVVPFEAMSETQKRHYIDHGNGRHASGPVEGCPLCSAPPVRGADEAGPAGPPPAKKAAAKKAPAAKKAAARA